MKNSRRYEIKNEVWNSITHGISIGFAIVGLVMLLLRATDIWQTISFAIYGSTLILLFLFSTLLHSLHFTAAEKVFQVLDHNGIFLLIAGTYTPYMLVSLRGPLGWTILIVIWLCTIIGIVFTSIFLPRQSKVPRFSVLLYILMGWVIIIAIWPLYQALAPTGFWLLVAGGVLYSIGAIIYRNKFPYAHVVWHLFVMIAALLMWLSIYGFVGK